MSGPNKFLLTQSLLSSWQYALKGGEMDEFLSALRREKKPQSKAMLDGIRFENVVHAVSEGVDIGPEQEWYKPIVEICKIITQGQYQVKASRPLVMDNVEFVCFGILDFLKAGVIYDTKFSRTYRVGKYLDSPQHPMYSTSARRSGDLSTSSATEAMYIVKYICQRTQNPSRQPCGGL